jgi:hypothetical protein
MIKNICSSSTRYSYPILIKLYFSPQISEINTQTSYYMERHPVETELFHANGQMARHDKAAAFSKFSE